MSDRILRRFIRLGRLCVLLRVATDPKDLLWRLRTAEQSRFGPFTHTPLLAVNLLHAEHGVGALALYLGPITARVVWKPKVLPPNYGMNKVPEVAS